MKNLFRGLRNSEPKPYVTVVSGLPRSGTSMMMKMLEAGGIPPVTDNVRTADDDNPKGYYEFERVKKMPEGDKSWVKDALGKSVKVISALLEHLPAEYPYRVIFMQRKMDEILASQKQMLVRSDKPTDAVSDAKLAEMYARHLAKVEAWLNAQPNVEVIYMDYNTMLTSPQEHAEEVNSFLDERLAVEKMVGVIDRSLYRQRL